LKINFFRKEIIMGASSVSGKGVGSAESANKGDIGYLSPASKSYGPGYNTLVELGSSPNS
jgi:hypothetical protein